MCEFNSPALRISNIVKGRERRPDGRVVYYLDPLGENAIRKQKTHSRKDCFTKMEATQQ